MVARHCASRLFTALLGLLLAGLAGCAYEPPRDKTLYPPTAQEAALIEDLRRQGLVLLIDGCVFGFTPDRRYLIGLSESLDIAKEFGELLPHLFAENGITVKQVVYPTICASHTHLGEMVASQTIDHSGIVKPLPIFMGPPPASDHQRALAEGYAELFERLRLDYFGLDDPNPRGKWGICAWCRPAIGESTPSSLVIDNETTLGALRSEFQTEFIMPLMIGHIKKTRARSRQERNEDIARAIATFIFSFGFATTAETADFGRSNPIDDTWAAVFSLADGKHRWSSSGKPPYGCYTGPNIRNARSAKCFYYPLLPPPPAP